MKTAFIIFYLLLLLLPIGCAGTRTNIEVEYNTIQTPVFEETFKVTARAEKSW